MLLGVLPTYVHQVFEQVKNYFYVISFVSFLSFVYVISFVKTLHLHTSNFLTVILKSINIMI